MDAIRTDSYSVHFSEPAYEALQALLETRNPSAVFLLTDSNTERDCLPVLKKRLPLAAGWQHFSIPAGEEHKTIATCLQVWTALSEAGADRKSLLVNLGGGVVTDLGGFVAATYQRGIAFVNIPTTLLSMVDASVGGKTGVDLGSLKNQVGVIEQPEMVLVCPEYLKTLPERELRSGFAEMLKHGLIRDAAYWEQLSLLEAPDPSPERIYHSVAIKNEVVLEDPTEQGLRKVLNFGHTLGHAVESYFLSAQDAPSLLHGEAIAVGMILEAFLSVDQCGLPRAACDRIKEVFLRHFPKVDISAAQQQAICALLIHDKKNVKGAVLFTLLEAVGKAVYNCRASDDSIARAFEYYRE